MNARFTMKELQAWIFNNYPIKFNRFTGKWDNLQNGPYGTPLDLFDMQAIWQEARKQFPGLTIGGIKNILTNKFGTDMLTDFGSANNLSYHRLYIIGNIALYFCAGDKFANPHYRIRYVTGD